MVKTTNQIGYCGTILIYEVYEPESSMNSPYLSWTHPTMVNPPLLLNNQWIQSVQTWSELVIRFIWSVAEWVQCLKWRNIRYPTQTWLFQRGAKACQGCNFIGEVYNQFPMQGTFFSGRDPGEDIEMWLQQSEMTMGIPKFHRDTICIGFSNCQAELKKGTLGDWS